MFGFIWLLRSLAAARCPGLLGFLTFERWSLGERPPRCNPPGKPLPTVLLPLGSFLAVATIFATANSKRRIIVNRLNHSVPLKYAGQLGHAIVVGLGIGVPVAQASAIGPHTLRRERSATPSCAALLPACAIYCSPDDGKSRLEKGSGLCSLLGSGLTPTAVLGGRGAG